MKEGSGATLTTDDLRLSAALLVTMLGFVVIAGLVWALPVKEGWEAAEVTGLVGTLTTVLGTIVGAFLGVQAGAAGKQKAEDLANKALASLSPDEAMKILHKDVVRSKQDEQIARKSGEAHPPAPVN